MYFLSAKWHSYKWAVFTPGREILVKYARIEKYKNDPGFEGVNHGSNFPKF